MIHVELETSAAGASIVRSQFESRVFPVVDRLGRFLREGRCGHSAQPDGSTVRRLAGSDPGGRDDAD
jgi:hypothetical protein